MSFNFTAADETKIVNFITDMQSTGSGLSALSLRRCVFQIAKKLGRAKTLFNDAPVFLCVL
jgi:hypothetical protein